MQLISLQELQTRWHRCRNLLKEHAPAAGGIVVFSRLNIYYLTGTFGNGLLWLPLEGEPVLLCRRGCGRARIESPLKNTYPFSTYKDVPGTLQTAGSPLSKTFAAEMNGMSWLLGNSFSKYLPDYEVLSGDRVLSMARSKKTEWELQRLRVAGAKHGACLTDLLPPLLRRGLSEFDIARTLVNLFFAEGHLGILRMETYGEEIYLGHIAIGDSGNYPSVFNGPLGLRGAHPAVPHMGSRDVRWEAGSPLTIDNGFTVEGYQSDKTQVYWLGNRRSIPSLIQAAHDCCIDIQAWIAERLKPGVRPSDLWNHSAAYAESRGFGEGFMGLDGNKVNFVGHGIGLAIDEYPALAKGFDLPLEEGMVLAIEPKIGIQGTGMVGVENTFEVAAQGGKCLTGDRYDIICIPE